MHDHDRVEEHAELALLLLHLVRPAGEPVAAERVVGCAGRDRVRLAPTLLDVGERLLPARPDPDVEAARVEPHVRAHDPRQEDVPDLVVDGVRPLDPVLLHEDAAEPEVRRDGCDLARVVRLHAADRDERVAALRERVGGEVLELAHLVAAVREAGVAVLALHPDVDRAPELLGEPSQRMHRRRAERQGDAVEVRKAHGADATRRSPEPARARRPVAAFGLSRIANAASEPTPTTAAPIHTAGVMPSTNDPPLP